MVQPRRRPAPKAVRNSRRPALALEAFSTSCALRVRACALALRCRPAHHALATVKKTLLRPRRPPWGRHAPDSNARAQPPPRTPVPYPAQDGPRSPCLASQRESFPGQGGWRAQDCQCEPRFANPDARRARPSPHSVLPQTTKRDHSFAPSIASSAFSLHLSPVSQHSQNRAAHAARVQRRRRPCNCHAAGAACGCEGTCLSQPSQLNRKDCTNAPAAQHAWSAAGGTAAAAFCSPVQLPA